MLQTGNRTCKIMHFPFGHDRSGVDADATLRLGGCLRSLNLHYLNGLNHLESTYQPR